jgi:hypothetical protein
LTLDFNKCTKASDFCFPFPDAESASMTYFESFCCSTCPRPIPDLQMFFGRMTPLTFCCLSLVDLYPVQILHLAHLK